MEAALFGALVVFVAALEFWWLVACEFHPSHQPIRHWLRHTVFAIFAK